jgi:histone-binding protein RBBP4
MQTSNHKKTINAEYLLWRKNIPNLYNLLINHIIEWPSLSVQWLPCEENKIDRFSQKILLSSHSFEKNKECLAIFKVSYPEFFDENGDDCIEKTRVNVEQKIFVKEEVNRAKCNPKQNNLIATRSDEKDVKIYDSEKVGDAKIVFNGHSKGGYGVDWNNFKENLLITCGEDDTVCLFDTNVLNSTKTEGDAVKIFTHHTAVVNDVCFSKKDENVCASVGDDNKICIQDIRNQKGSLYSAHESDILSVDWNFFDENMLCTGSADTTVKIWDGRKMNVCLHSCNYHSGSINQVRWSPHFENVFASCSNDRQVGIWDLDMVGDFVEEAPPELIFIHGGHKGNVCDIAWNPIEKWEIASVSHDNSLQIWSMASV